MTGRRGLGGALVRGVAAGALGLGLLAGAAATSPAVAAGRAAPSADAPLRTLAQHTGVRVGTAVNTDALADDATYRRLTGQQFDSVTPENVMKWEVVQPQRGHYDFGAADRLVRFAEAHHQQVRGHNLVWHNQLPAWLTSGTWTKAQLRSILKQHVQTEVSHFRGKIWAWDVVNEAIDDDGTLRDDLWSQTFGESYIADAFRWAHQADPHAILFYNDYNIEGSGAKQDAVVSLVKRLRAQGVPIQGVGLQGHLDTQYPLPDLGASLHRFAALGVKTAITEADVRIPLPADAAEVGAQDAGYTLMLQSCLLDRSCISFTVWGFADQYSWVPGTFPGEGQADVYDASYQPKSAYRALQRTLALAPKGKSRA